MDTVYVWHDTAHNYPKPVQRAVVVSHPEVNATSVIEWDPDQSHLRAYIVESWNRTFPNQPRALADFEYVDKPEDWVDPSARTEAGSGPRTAPSVAAPGDQSGHARHQVRRVRP